MSATLSRVIALAEQCSGLRDIGPASTIDRDCDMAGGDVENFVSALAHEYGEWIWEWPWHRFAILDEGLSLLFPFVLIWQLLSWPFCGQFSPPSQLEQLTLEHIANVIDAGQWFDP